MPTIGPAQDQMAARPLLVLHTLFVQHRLQGIRNVLRFMDQVTLIANQVSAVKKFYGGIHVIRTNISNN